MKTYALRTLMVCANDRRNHDVCFSRMADGWMLENEEQGFVSVHNSFAAAISAMEKAVGLCGSGYEWTVRGNPYSGD